MTAHDLRNMLCILRSIDKYEIDTVLGVPMDEAQWRKFRDGPYDFYMRCDDRVRQTIWSIVERRHIRALVGA